MFRTLWEGLVNIVYPNICLLCRRSINRDAQSLCLNCISEIEKNIPPFCQKCGRHIYEANNELGLCLSCQKSQLHFKRAFSACFYEGKIKGLIALFKYKGKTALSKPLANILTDFIKQYRIPLQQIDAIMPIPLHSVRLREREYNQSQLLAREITKEFNLELDNHSLIRTKNTTPQIELNDKQRWQNVAGAFKLHKKQSVLDKRILLIDDLLTTGATCSEAAYVLKDNGAKEVYVLTLASTN